MAGALAERVFVDKMTSVGFTEVQVRERRPFSLADAARYPLFTPDLIQVMQDLLRPEQRDQVALAVTVTARKAA